jgi:hypothetical protein
MNGAIRSFGIEERRPIGSSWWNLDDADVEQVLRFDSSESFDSMDSIADAPLKCGHDVNR